MVRTAFDARTDDEDKPRSMIWDGTVEAADRIRKWSATGSLELRFSWSPATHTPHEARVLVERPFPDSSEWVLTPVGTVIERLGRDEDAPLRLHLPPAPNPIAVLEEK